MYNNGIKGKLWRILKRTYDNCYAAVSVNGLTDWFPVTVGVKQGGIMSMLYYICFVNELLEGLSSLDIGCSIGNSKCASVAYADDIAVCALHAPCIQAMMDYAWEYSNTWRFDFNINKCAVLVYGESRGEKNTRKNNT